MARKNKGYDRALRDAHGDESKVHYNYGWYAEVGKRHGCSGTEYDENGNPIIYT